MENKFTRMDIIKYIFIFPLLVFVFYQFMRTYDNKYLYAIILYLAIIIIYEFIINRNKSYLSNEVNSYIKKIEELNEVISKQRAEIEHLYKQSTAMNNQLIDSINKLVSFQKELKLKNEELEALRDASEIITSTFDVNVIIEYTYKIFNKFTGCDKYFINFVDKETGKLVSKYEFGDITFEKVGRLFDEDTTAINCFKNRQTILSMGVLIKSRGTIGDRIAIPLNVSGEVVGVICIESGVPGMFQEINIKFLESLANHGAIAIKNAELFNSIFVQKQEIEALYEETAAVNEELNSYIEELDKTKEELKQKNQELTKYYNDIHTGYLQTVMALANSIEAKDPYTRGHCQRVMDIACEIGKRMGYGDDQIEDLRYAAILHDIGKIGIPAHILNKEGKLTDEEFSEIKRHPLIAYTILKDVEFIKNGLDAILQHHERYDGKGYPYGRTGEEVCTFARILCIADAFDAMTSDRPYRKGRSMEEALREIERCKGSQFDPEITDLFIKMSREIIDTDGQVKGEFTFGQERGWPGEPKALNG